MYYAVGQAAIAVQCRSDDADTLKMLEGLDHEETSLRTHAERAFMVLGPRVR
jgi:hydroxymethylbilane synthase